VTRRLVFNQADTWGQQGDDVYSQEQCCYCGKRVRKDAKRLCLARTEDGEWWLVEPGYKPGPDDMDGYGMFTLPVGPDCLRKHPEWRFAVSPS